MKFNFKFSKRNIIIIAVTAVVIILVALVYLYVFRKAEQYQYTTFEAKRGNLIQSVSATGTVKAVTDVELNFNNSGQISEIKVKVGDDVKKGDLLAELESKRLKALVGQANANLAQQQANYEKLLAGASVEDINVSEQNLTNAQINLKTAQDNYDNLKAKLEKELQSYQEAVESVETAYDNAKLNLDNIKDNKDTEIKSLKDTALTQLDSEAFKANASLNVIYDTLNNVDAQRTLGILNREALDNANRYYDLTQDDLAKTNLEISSARSVYENEAIIEALNRMIVTLNYVTTTLNYTFDALLGTVTSQELSQTDLDTLKTNIRNEQTKINSSTINIQTAKSDLVNSESQYKTKVDSAQAAVDTALNNLISAQTDLSIQQTEEKSQLDDLQAKVDEAKGNVDLNSKMLDLKKAQPREFEIKLQKSLVASASANLSVALSNLQDNQILAPAEGVITKINYQVGEQTISGKAVMVLESKNNFEIEVDIPESDIAKVRVDNICDITLDAFGPDKIFKGKVTSIEPSETLIQDVVYYKVKVNFQEADEAIKSGMTADVDIKTASKDNVIIIPQRAVNINYGVKTVEILVNNTVEVKEVETGLKGDEGLVEVISGVNEGDKVITFKKKI